MLIKKSSQKKQKIYAFELNDFRIGKTIKINDDFIIYDCDAFTRNYYTASDP